MRYEHEGKTFSIPNFSEDFEQKNSNMKSVS